jgi:hypothetical protein
MMFESGTHPGNVAGAGLLTASPVYKGVVESARGVIIKLPQHFSKAGKGRV